MLYLFGSSKMGMLDLRGGVEFWSTALPWLTSSHRRLSSVAPVHFNACVVRETPHSAASNLGILPLMSCCFCHLSETTLLKESCSSKHKTECYPSW